MESLHKQVLPFLLRRLKSDVLQDLPPKIIQDYYCELSPLQVREWKSHPPTAHGWIIMNFIADTREFTTAGTFIIYRELFSLWYKRSMREKLLNSVERFWFFSSVTFLVLKLRFRGSRVPVLVPRFPRFLLRYQGCDTMFSGGILHFSHSGTCPVPLRFYLGFKSGGTLSFGIRA